MRSRRISVRRDAGRRRLRRITLVLALVALVVLALVATRTPLLDVDRVTVAGNERTSVDDVRNAAGIRLGEPLLSIDLGTVASRVEELPWVASADVTRSWPSTVKIQVTEREPVAVVQVTNDLAAMIDVIFNLLVYFVVTANFALVQPSLAVDAPRIGKALVDLIGGEVPKFDEPAILGALETEARYIGAVGSRKTNADRRERMREAGVSEEELAAARIAEEEAAASAAENSWPTVVPMPWNSGMATNWPPV